MADTDAAEVLRHLEHATGFKFTAMHTHPAGNVRGLDVHDACLFRLWKDAAPQFTHLIQANFNRQHTGRCVAYGTSTWVRDGVAASDHHVKLDVPYRDVSAWMQMDTPGMLGDGWVPPFMTVPFAPPEVHTAITKAMDRQRRDPGCKAGQKYARAQAAELVLQAASEPP